MNIAGYGPVSERSGARAPRALRSGPPRLGPPGAASIKSKKQTITFLFVFIYCTFLKNLLSSWGNSGNGWKSVETAASDVGTPSETEPGYSPPVLGCEGGKKRVFNPLYHPTRSQRSADSTLDPKPFKPGFLLHGCSHPVWPRCPGSFYCQWAGVTAP